MNSLFVQCAMLGNLSGRKTTCLVAALGLALLVTFPSLSVALECVVIWIAVGLLLRVTLFCFCSEPWALT